MRWARFCNWLEAEPWRWRYRVIWNGIQGDPPWWQRLWWTITFPHVHHDEDIEALTSDQLRSRATQLWQAAYELDQKKRVS